MKRNSYFNKFLSLLFAVTVVYTVSVREVHYLFSQHQVHEHCENHLHSDEHQEDCSVCKVDVSLFTDVVYSPSSIRHDYLSATNDIYHLPVPLLQFSSGSYIARAPSLSVVITALLKIVSTTNSINHFLFL